MLRAIIFDFNGVLLNDEPLHYRAMRDSVASLGISLGEEEYWGRYLPLDDVNCLKSICADHTVDITADQARSILLRKASLYEQLLQNQYPLFPGASNFVRRAAEKYPLALASGARREEIEKTLHATGLRPCFRVVVGAEDFSCAKPHPQSYLLALSKLNASLNGQSSSIVPADSLVVEDSMAGVQGARAAGMMCLAVTNSYPREKLIAANLVIDSLREIGIDDLRSLLEERP